MNFTNKWEKSFSVISRYLNFLFNKGTWVRSFALTFFLTILIFACKDVLDLLPDNKVIISGIVMLLLIKPIEFFFAGEFLKRIKEIWIQLDSFFVKFSTFLVASFYSFILHITCFFSGYQLAIKYLIKFLMYLDFCPANPAFVIGPIFFLTMFFPCYSFIAMILAFYEELVPKDKRNEHESKLKEKQI